MVFLSRTIPQNRERVFIVGIRPDIENKFVFPSGFKLTKCLKDILEAEVDKKYFISEKAYNGLVRRQDNQIAKGGGFGFVLKTENEISNTILASYHKGGKESLLKIKSPTGPGFEIANDGDSINLSTSFANTRRRRVGKGVAQTIDTACMQGPFVHGQIRRFTPRECFRLQGFPDSFKFVVSENQLYRQAGNSITVDIIQAIIKNILHLLK